MAGEFLTFAFTLLNPLFVVNKKNEKIRGIAKILDIFKFIFDLLGFGVLIFGASASGRQIYLQNLPADQLTGGYCDIPFEFLFNMYPFFDALSKVFQGSSKCAEESWVFLYLNIPEWALLFFTSMIILLLIRYFLINLKGQK